jgi:hypothetical protein
VTGEGYLEKLISDAASDQPCNFCAGSTPPSGCAIRHIDEGRGRDDPLVLRSCNPAAAAVRSDEGGWFGDTSTVRIADFDLRGSCLRNAFRRAEAQRAATQKVRVR